MGVFWQTVKVGNPEGGDSVEMEAMVDTGATDSVFPRTLLEDLRVQPVTSYKYAVADGRSVELPYGMALITINDATWHCPVVFGPGDDALLGATTLEIFKLLVDPNSQSLQPADSWPLGRGHRPTVAP